MWILFRYSQLIKCTTKVLKFSTLWMHFIKADSWVGIIKYRRWYGKKIRHSLKFCGEIFRLGSTNFIENNCYAKCNTKDNQRFFHIIKIALGIVSPNGLRIEDWEPRLNGLAAKARRRCRNAPNLKFPVSPNVVIECWWRFVLRISACTNSLRIYDVRI